jgi:hypothetical protein
MKKSFRYIVLLIVLLPHLIMADANASSTLMLKGVVAPKSLFGLTGLFDISPNAVRLDEGAILLSAGGVGIEVGQWSVSSNSSSALVLRLQHPAGYATAEGGEIVGTFNATVNDQPVRIPYRINNGSGWVYDGDVFATLVRNGGTYKPEQNNGPVYLQRTDANTYPPFDAYQTTIQLILEAL